MGIISPIYFETKEDRRIVKSLVLVREELMYMIVFNSSCTMNIHIYSFVKSARTPHVHTSGTQCVSSTFADMD